MPRGTLILITKILSADHRHVPLRERIEDAGQPVDQREPEADPLDDSRRQRPVDEPPAGRGHHLHTRLSPAEDVTRDGPPEPPPAVR